MATTTPSMPNLNKTLRDHALERLAEQEAEELHDLLARHNLADIAQPTAEQQAWINIYAANIRASYQGRRNAIYQRYARG